MIHLPAHNHLTNTIIMETKLVQLTVLVRINKDADVSETLCNTDYDFLHEDIVDTELCDWEVLPDSLS